MSLFSITLITPVRSAWSVSSPTTSSTVNNLMQLDLFSAFARQRQLEVAIDGLAERFGTNVVYRADDLNKRPGMRLAPTLDFLHDRTLD